MQILLTAATEPEIFSGHTAYSQVTALVTGVGIPAVSYHLSKALLTHHYDLVIQTGIAGCYAPNDFPLGSLVFVKQDRFADLGVWENNQFMEVSTLGFQQPNEKPFQDGWLVNKSTLPQHMEAKTAVGISVNSLNDDPLHNEHFAQKYKADVESMEGAALHYVCLQQDVPFFQLRSISNKVGERDKQKWMLKEALENLNLQSEKLLQQILK